MWKPTRARWTIEYVAHIDAGHYHHRAWPVSWKKLHEIGRNSDVIKQLMDWMWHIQVGTSLQSTTTTILMFQIIQSASGHVNFDKKTRLITAILRQVVTVSWSGGDYCSGFHKFGINEYGSARVPHCIIRMDAESGLHFIIFKKYFFWKIKALRSVPVPEPIGTKQKLEISRSAYYSVKRHRDLYNLRWRKYRIYII